jgi:FtsP/CotA-like multicopper oxidase with cupredoxin domain
MSLKLAALGLLSLLALAGCATTSQNATKTQTPQDALIAPTATITASQVTLATDRPAYKPGDSVRITIANGRSVSIYAIGSKVNCTALDLEVKTASGWQASNVASCDAQTVLDTLEIKPGSVATVTIPAPAAGTYRCTLQYTTINIPPPRNAPSSVSGAVATKSTSGPAAIAYSAEWEVKSS